MASGLSSEEILQEPKAVMISWNSETWNTSKRFDGYYILLSILGRLAADC